MKSKFWVGLVLGALLAALLLTVFDDLLPQFMRENFREREYAVYLEVKGPTDKKVKIKPKKGNTDCPGESGKFGCLTVAEDDEAVVKFSLTNKVHGKIFHVSEMKICKGTTKENQICNLSEEEQGEFAITAHGRSKRYYPDEFGVINFRQIHGDIFDFSFFDNNSFPGDYFYSIKVCLPGEVGSECRDTDPPIRNGGRTMSE